MSKLNRTSSSDAKKAIEKLLPESNARKIFINFLADSVSYADSIKSDNWSLNLDLQGKFLRFNVGQEYCITLYYNELLILCNRTTLKNVMANNSIPIEFYGYNNNQYYRNTEIDKVPNLLAKTKDNVGCILKSSEIEQYINFLSEANKDFIDGAIKTHLMPNMKNSHSKGAVEFIFSEFGNEIETPNYSEFVRLEQANLTKAQKLTQDERLEILKTINAKPTKTTVNQTVFIRSQIVVAVVLYRADGKCEKCKCNAPFLRDIDNTPYLEVHHIVTLAEGGDDTIENAIALCPNCHRQAHYGKRNAI
ncbi:HNH endonuclease [Ferruginibacter sp.]